MEKTIAILALVVSFFSFLFAFWKGRYDQITSIKPALVFVYDAGGWVIQNVGAGPALNIIVAKKELGKEGRPDRWIEPVRIPPMKRDGSFALHWDPHNNTYGLGATYEDMWSRPYTTTCGRDLNRIRSGLHLGEWKESTIQAEWALRPR